MLNTPILFLVFNRLDTTKQVFAKIRNVQPSQLFIAADGPRPQKEGENEKTELVRKFILENIDWPCEVKTLFRHENLGCGHAVSQAITWFFEQVEQGIILEDDCLPDLSFFRFCEELLEKYQNDRRIMHIGGVNFQPKSARYEGSYYFSKYPHIWGWATWSRAWKFYNFSVSSQDFQNIYKTTNIRYNKERRFWKKYAYDLSTVKIDTWDIQWVLATFKNNSFSITPSVNLVENIGFNVNATHTKDPDPFHIRASKEIIFPLVHQEKICIDFEKDFYYFNHSFRKWYKLDYFNLIFSLAKKLKTYFY